MGLLQSSGRTLSWAADIERSILNARSAQPKLCGALTLDMRSAQYLAVSILNTRLASLLHHEGVAGYCVA